MSKKKTYIKPVIQDLGSMMIGSAQMPMGLCQSGITPSASGSECEAGSTVHACGGGGLHDTQAAWCLPGTTAASMCSEGGSF